MRQLFDIGDLVTVHKGQQAIIVEKKLLNENMTKGENWSWHPDEYTCKVRILKTHQIQWVRARWLEHLSKINQ